MASTSIPSDDEKKVGTNVSVAASIAEASVELLAPHAAEYI